MPGARCRMDSRPPAHWLVAFSLRFCGSASPYESQTLAALRKGTPRRNRRRSVESIQLPRAAPQGVCA